MPRAVALLRAINVGGRFVKMERLRALAEAAGLAGVETYIQSGNLLFDCPARGAARLEARLESLWREQLPWEFPTLVRSAQEIEALVAEGEHLGHGLKGEARHYVAFLREQPASAAGAIVEGWSYAKERLVLRGRELHFWCTIPSHEAKFTNARAEKALGMHATVRDWNTVLALRERLGKHAR